MIHETRKIKSDVIIMWSEPHIKEEQTIKACSKVEINKGDFINVGTTKNEEPIFYEINSVVESRPATVRGYDYVTMKAVKKIGYRQ